MFTVKARRYIGGGSAQLKVFECDTFDINHKMDGEEVDVVVSCYGTSADRTQDREFEGQDFVHLDVVPADVSKSKYDRAVVWHEVYIENAMGKTTEVVKCAS